MESVKTMLEEQVFLDELIQFKTTSEQLALVKAWAKEDDRTVAYMMRKLIEAERVRRIKQLPLVVEETAEEPADQMMRRLRVQGLPGFISNELPPSKSPSVAAPVGKGEFHLGTGPGDEAGK